MSVSGIKRVYNRKYPGIKGKRPDKKYKRQVEAVTRHEAYQDLPPADKAERNPKKFVLLPADVANIITK